MPPKLGTFAFTDHDFLTDNAVRDAFAGPNKPITAHVGGLTALCDGLRETCDRITSDRGLTAEGRSARKRVAAQEAVAGAVRLLTRFEGPILGAIETARRALPALDVRPGGDFNDGWRRDESHWLNAMERDRLLRMDATTRLADLQAAAAAGDRDRLGALGPLSDAQRRDHFGISPEQWAEIVRAYGRTIDPGAFASLTTAETALAIVRSNHQTALRAIEGIAGYSAGALTASDAAANLKAAGS